MNNRIIRLKELTTIIGLSRSAIYDRLDNGSPRFDPKFPRPRKLGGTGKTVAIGWFLDDVEAWMREIPPQ